MPKTRGRPRKTIPNEEEIKVFDEFIKFVSKKNTKEPIENKIYNINLTFT